MKVIIRRMIGPCCFCGEEFADVRISGFTMTGVRRVMHLCKRCAYQLADTITPLPEMDDCSRIVKDLRQQRDNLSIFMRGELSELLDQAAATIEGLEKEVTRYK